MEYVADEVQNGEAAPERTLDDLEEAIERLEIYMLARAEAAIEAIPGDPVVLLSGGIDSIATAATLCHLGYEPLCVTVIGTDGHFTDRARAQQAASELGLRHEIVELDSPSLGALAGRMINVLDTDELWEVTAAIPIRAAFDFLHATGRTEGPVFTGGGADILLAGGKKVQTPPEGPGSRSELEQLIWGDFLSHFTYERQIPDFYHRVLGRDEEGSSISSRLPQPGSRRSDSGPPFFSNVEGSVARSKISTRLY